MNGKTHRWVWEICRERKTGKWTKIAHIEGVSRAGGMWVSTGISEKQNKESGVKRILGFDREKRELEWEVETVELDLGKKSSIKTKSRQGKQVPSAYDSEYTLP